MEDPGLARVAGEAFSMITGIDLAYAGLERDPQTAITPRKDPDPETPPTDNDEHVPAPDSSLVCSWWQKNSHNMQLAIRYINGSAAVYEDTIPVWLNGFQRQRRAAAYEMVLQHANGELPNWRDRSVVSITA